MKLFVAEYEIEGAPKDQPQRKKRKIAAESWVDAAHRATQDITLSTRLVVLIDTTQEVVVADQVGILPPAPKGRYL